eukprot:7151035-Pyramimonas_sp.AAC.1
MAGAPCVAILIYLVIHKSRLNSEVKIAPCAIQTIERANIGPDGSSYNPMGWLPAIVLELRLTLGLAGFGRSR